MIEPQYYVPFCIGFIPVVVWFCYWIPRDAYRMRHNVSSPWEYDSDVKQAWEYFWEHQFQNYRWGIIVVLPFLIGEFVWICYTVVRYLVVIAPPLG